VHAESPLVMEHEAVTASATWVISPAPRLPFGAWAQTVESLVAEGPLRNAGGTVQHVSPYFEVNQGPGKDQVHVVWPSAVRGKVIVRLRIDDAR
jgi:hypothetical protein